MRDLRKPPAPWLFSLLILPLGIVVVGFNFTAFPLLLWEKARFPSTSAVTAIRLPFTQLAKTIERASQST